MTNDFISCYFDVGGKIYCVSVCVHVCSCVGVCSCVCISMFSAYSTNQKWFHNYNMLQGIFYQKSLASIGKVGHTFRSNTQEAKADL